jgi:hypothetical protein
MSGNRKRRFEVFSNTLIILMFLKLLDKCVVICPWLEVEKRIGPNGHEMPLEEIALWNEFPMLGEWVTIFLRGAPIKRVIM